MLVQILAVGRMRNGPLRTACDDYERRLQRFLRLEIKEVRDAGLRDRDAVAARRVESAALRDAMHQGTRVIALTREGRQMDSVEFAEWVQHLRRQARDAAFLIGGAHGLDDSLLQESDETLSLSNMTLPHELSRLVLLEQLYRACTILDGGPYHKGRRSK